MKPLFKRPLLLIIGLLNSFILLSQDFSNLDFMVLELKSVSCYEGDECRFIFTNYNNEKLEFDWFLPFNAKERSPEKEFRDKYGGDLKKAVGSIFQVYYDKDVKNPGICRLVEGEGYFCTKIRLMTEVEHTFRDKNIKDAPQIYFNVIFYTYHPSVFYKFWVEYDRNNTKIIDDGKYHADYNIRKGEYNVVYEYYTEGGLEYRKTGYFMLDKNKVIDLSKDLYNVDYVQKIEDNGKINQSGTMKVLKGEFSTDKALSLIYREYTKDGEYFKWTNSVFFDQSDNKQYRHSFGGYKSKVNNTLRVNDKVKILIIETEPQDKFVARQSGNLFSIFLFKKIGSNWELTNSFTKQVFQGNFDYINLGSEVGLMIKNSDNQMGYYTEWVELYSTENETFKMVLKVTTSNDNSGAVSSASERYGYKSEISSQSSGNEFYDIHIHKKGKKKVSGSIIELDETQIYKYNGEKYVLH